MSHAILIIDDEPSILQAIKRLLHQDGYQIHLANNGQAALDVLAQTEIAVIICDQKMSGMSGTEVLAESARLCPNAYRISLTGYADVATAQILINEGHVHHFLLKPWDDNQLRDVVRKGVRAYQLALDNQRSETRTRQQTAELKRWKEQLEQQVQQRTKELHDQNNALLTIRHHLETALRDTVAIVAGVLEAYSPNLGMHAKRVAQLARNLAEQLDLKAEQIRDIEFAAYLHDIGRIAKPHVKVMTPRQLSGDQRNQDAVLEALAGYSILAGVTGFEDVARGIRHQYERFDGHGSPDGLKGTEIPLISRIIAVTNAFDCSVFASTDPSTMLLAEGYHVLSEDENKRFDPQLVQMLLFYLSKEGIDPDETAEVEVSTRQLRRGMILSRPIYNADNVLLLKEGMNLTAELIERIQEMSDINPLLRGIFVRCTVADNHANNIRRSSGSLPICYSDRDTKLSSPHPPRMQYKVLLVDDTILVCSALKRQLRPLGIETAAAHDGSTALAMVAHDHFDAAIIDVKMPAMSGEELVGHLAQCASSLPCIILTGSATRERVVRLSKAPNVTGILTKPWEQDRLITAISTAIAKGAQEPIRELAL